MIIQRLNSDTMYKSQVFSQAAVIESGAKLVFVGGQNGIGTDGKVVGSDIASQSVQAYKNVIAALDAAGATMDDVFKMTIYIVQGNSLQEAFAAVQKVQTRQSPPSTVTGLFVAALANPYYLIEIDAVAAIQG